MQPSFIGVLGELQADGRILFGTRIARLFAYGFLSVVLVLYLARVGLTEAEIGLLLTLTLVGDTVISLWITTSADRIGRRRMLIFGALLMVMAGVIFAVTQNYVLLLIAATIGVISPSGYEVGPFLSIEQAALSQIV
ncbi:MAG: MFS transporter, partial [Rudaea sp.]